MRELTALRPLVYATRRLKPGEDFTTKTDRDARILIAVGRAKARRVPGKIAPPPADVVQKVVQSNPPDNAAEDLSKLRSEYQELIGKRPFMGWDAAELQRRIDEVLAS